MRRRQNKSMIREEKYECCRDDDVITECMNQVIRKTKVMKSFSNEEMNKREEGFCTSDSPLKLMLK